MTNSAIVLAFIQAWERRDTGAILAFFTDDAAYQNIPMAPMIGQAAIEAFIAPFIASTSEIVWEVHHIAETKAGIVLTERTDRFLIAGRWIAAPVMGIFELRDGKILAWRDYADLAGFMAQLSGGQN